MEIAVVAINRISKGIRHIFGEERCGKHSQHNMLHTDTGDSLVIDHITTTIAISKSQDFQTA
jgi:hypothetical protein